MINDYDNLVKNEDEYLFPLGINKEARKSNQRNASQFKNENTGQRGHDDNNEANRREFPSAANLDLEQEVVADDQDEQTEGYSERFDEAPSSQEMGSGRNRLNNRVNFAKLRQDDDLS